MTAAASEHFDDDVVIYPFESIRHISAFSERARLDDFFSKSEGDKEKVSRRNFLCLIVQMLSSRRRRRRKIFAPAFQRDFQLLTQFPIFNRRSFPKVANIFEFFFFFFFRELFFEREMSLLSSRERSALFSFLDPFNELRRE